MKPHYTLLGRALAVALATLGAAASAQDFPAKPIRIVVGSAPGALLDVASRAYGERMATSLKGTVVIENVAGASSLLAIRQVARAAPDGHTLLAAANTFVTTPHMSKAASYDPQREFTPIGEMVRSPALLVTAASTPFRSIADIVAAAKRDPGGVAYASGGTGTTSHLPAELFQRQAGIRMTHIPYKGNAMAVPDTAAGRVAFMMGTASSIAELIKSGALRPLAITSETRSAAFPNLPTFKELGYGEATFDIWVGLFGPAGVNKAVRTRLGEAMEAARNDAALRQRLAALGQDISPIRTPEAFEVFVKAEEEKYRKLIIEAKIVAD